MSKGTKCQVERDVVMNSNPLSSMDWMASALSSGRLGKAEEFEGKEYEEQVQVKHEQWGWMV